MRRTTRPTTPRSSSPTPPRRLRARYVGHRVRGRPFPAARPSATASTVGTEWTGVTRAGPGRGLRPLPGSGGADRLGRRPPGRGPRLPRTPAGPSVAGLAPADTAAHLRDHGRGLGRTRAATGSGRSPSDGGRCGSGHGPVSACMSRNGASRPLRSSPSCPTDVADGAPLPAYVALGSPCVEHLRPRLRAHRRRRTALRAVRALERGDVAGRRALRQRVDADPDAIGPIREVLAPVEAELWAEADDGVEHPTVGPRWGGRGAAGPFKPCSPAAVTHRSLPLGAHNAMRLLSFSPHPTSSCRACRRRPRPASWSATRSST